MTARPVPRAQLPALADYPPSGCHHCGLGKRLHFDRWTDAAGWHEYAESSRELIAERMRAKYADRADFGGRA